ncbi:putative leucine zipper, homeobox-associated [Helianthus annuus]|nr:putative leucine zipper, homeobox-associated [Helianthus annuus]
MGSSSCQHQTQLKQISNCSRNYFNNRPACKFNKYSGDRFSHRHLFLRTKLKQTEVDCEYLKTCCETLTEENKRLQKELQELRALKTSQPFYMQLPATTLTMCPSCERVVTTSSTTTTPPNTTATTQQQPTNP